MEQKRDRLFECLTGVPDTKLRPYPSNGPNYRRYLSHPNIHPMATKMATKFDHRYLNIIRWDNIP